MRKPRWKVEFRACVQSDGLERLGRMVHLVIDRGVDNRRADEESGKRTPLAALEDPSETPEVMT